MVDVQITFSNPQSSEYEASLHLKEFFEKNFKKAEKGRILIASNFTCYGQIPKDIDLVVFGEFQGVSRKVWSRAISRRGDEQIEEEYSHKYVNIKSFCLTIEVKDQPFNSIKIKDQRVMVAYHERNQRNWHDATYQSEHQKYSLGKYLNQHIQWYPWSCNFIWLRNVASEDLPRIPDNLWGATLNFEQMLMQICDQRLPFAYSDAGQEYYNLVAGRKPGDEVFEDLERAFNFSTNVEKNLGKLTREKLERITKAALLQDQQYAKSIGEKLVVVRGRPGTGKTIKLLHIAHDLSVRHDQRCLVLTYNKALVSDIRRMIFLAKIPSDIAEATLEVKTIHSYIRTLLIGFDLYEAEGDGDGQYFLSNYDELKSQLRDFLKAGAISSSDIQDLMREQYGEVAWDYILIDEGQDWPSDERDILYTLYPPRKFIIADGMAQLIRTQNRTNWTAGVEYHKPIIAEKTSLRQKANLCRFVELFAEKSGITWDVTPRDDLPGGKVIIIANSAANGYDRELHQILRQECDESGNKPYEMMFLIPPSMVLASSDSKRFKFIREFNSWGIKIWDGTSTDIRSEYPTDVEEHRFLQYDSARGLEGWSVICLWLDEFVKYKMDIYQPVSGEQRSLGLSGPDEERRVFAFRWSLIALTRAIDTIVISLRNPNSLVGRMLREIALLCPDFVEWHE